MPRSPELDSPVDPLHGSSRPDSTWTTTNISEAFPGVQTPLASTILAPANQRVSRRVFRSIGALSRSEALGARPGEDEILEVFAGRLAMRVAFFCQVGDRLPGTSGSVMAEQYFGVVPAEYESRHTTRRYPYLAARLPVQTLRAPRLVRKDRQTTAEWWRREIREMSAVDLEDARSRLLGAAAWFEHVLLSHVLVGSMVVQPLNDQVRRLVEATELPADDLMAGYGGHEEMHLLSDLWSCSRGHLDADSLIERQGFHGPREGQLTSVVWREDREPLLVILEGYRDLGEDVNPEQAEAMRAERRVRAEQRLLAALPRARRPGARSVLALARRYVPLRSVGKVSFLQSLDVIRASARRLGECLGVAGVLDDPDDVFFLTLEEIGRRDWAGAAGERIEVRRDRYQDYLKVDLPVTWQGMPQPVSIGLEESARTDVLEGVAASPGVVEGFVRVLSAPGEEPVGPGEIVVAHTTDPSWVSVMMVSAALVMDIGGLLSHAAVIARELGIPCVAGTKVATQILRTGDYCRVDGTSGRVEVVKRSTSE